MKIPTKDEMLWDISNSPFIRSEIERLSPDHAAWITRELANPSWKLREAVRKARCRANPTWWEKFEAGFKQLFQVWKGRE